MEKETRDLAAIVDEYIALKGSMMRIRDLHERRTGREMSQRSAPALYKTAAARRDELQRLFPGRPWAKHSDYLRLANGETTVGCADAPSTVPQAPSAEANICSDIL